MDTVEFTSYSGDTYEKWQDDFGRTQCRRIKKARLPAWTPEPRMITTSEMMQQLRDENQRLTALCGEYRGELDRMTTENSALRILHDECAAESVVNGAEVERLNGIVTALEEGCHSCQHPKRVEELTCQKNALQQVVGERDAEIERLKKKQAQITKDADAGMVENLAIIWNLNDEKEALQSALTRARAEGMEEGLETAAKIAESHVRFDFNQVTIAAAIRTEACRLAEQANKGEE